MLAYVLWPAQRTPRARPQAPADGRRAGGRRLARCSSACSPAAAAARRWPAAATPSGARRRRRHADRQRLRRRRRCELAAGPTTFKVTNDGQRQGRPSSRSSSGARILGEKENITAGLSGSFSLTLSPALRDSAARAATTRAGTLVVDRAGAAARRPTRQLRRPPCRATARYVERPGRRARRAARGFAAAVHAGDVEKAKRALRRPARVPYERIEPVAESLRRPRPRDRRARQRRREGPGVDGLPPHRAGAVGRRHDRRGTTPVADKLVADVETLETKLAARRATSPPSSPTARSSCSTRSRSRRSPARRSATRTLDLRRLPGQRGRRPAGLRRARARAGRADDPTLATRSSARFDAVDAALKPYRRGATFVDYDDADAGAAAQAQPGASTQLAEPLSRRQRRAGPTGRGRIGAAGRRAAGLLGAGAAPRHSPRRACRVSRSAAVAARRGRPAADDQVVPFYGEHQAGIATAGPGPPPLRRLRPRDRRPRATLRDLLREWTAAGAPNDRRAAWSATPTTSARAARRHRRGRRPRCPRASPSPSASARRLFDDRLRPGRRSGPAALQPTPAAARRRARPRAKAAATSASRPAPTTPRSPSTRSATWPGSAAAPW